MHSKFTENKDGSIYALVDMEFIISKRNIVELPSGNFDCMLFGSVVLVHNPKTSTKMYTINLPTRVVLAIYSQDQWFEDEDEHYIISFAQGSKIIENETVVTTVKYVADIVDNITHGNVSSLIPYHMYYDIVMEAQKINGQLGVPKVLYEILISELSLDSSKKKPARFSSNNDFGIITSVNESVLHKNTFNVMTFEDWSKGLYYSKKKPFDKQSALPSALEEYMRK